MISFVLRQKLCTKDFYKNVDFYTKKERCNEQSKTHQNEPAGLAGEFEYILKSASNLNCNLKCSKEREHYAS